MEMVGTDVRIAGERLEQRGGPNIMPIEIVKGENGDPDELILRRNLLDYTLPVCDTLNADNAEHNINVRQVGNNPPWNNYPECQGHPGEVPHELEIWREYRDNQGGDVRIYIYDPIIKIGEFFIYDHDDSSDIQVHRKAGKWKNSYGNDVGNSGASEKLPKLYVLEERRYRLNTENNILELVINGNDEEVKNIAGEIFDFRVQAVMIDGSTVDEISTTSHWRNLKAIKVTLESKSSVQDETVQRTISSRFFPRNVMSEM
ncbi:hypothetical protein [Desulfonatronospira thiodismutans]|nr:hypothetical protein [Desulfonatronospira thiodismutans]